MSKIKLALKTKFNMNGVGIPLLCDEKINKHNLYPISLLRTVFSYFTPLWVMSVSSYKLLKFSSQFPTLESNHYTPHCKSNILSAQLNVHSVEVLSSRCMLLCRWPQVYKKLICFHAQIIIMHAARWFIILPHYNCVFYLYPNHLYLSGALFYP